MNVKIAAAIAINGFINPFIVVATFDDNGCSKEYGTRK
jgi:hypothetical protein